MPGKQDPYYFPLNLNSLNLNLNNMNGYYGEVGPILIPHHHRTMVHHGSPIAMALHNSPVNATFLSDNLMSEYINMNVNSLPPVNSEDEEELLEEFLEEEEEEDDNVSVSGSESVSVQGSELDLDSMDDVDSLVLNIRDKLRMAGKKSSINKVPSSCHSAGDYCWTESPSAASTPNSIQSTAEDSNHASDLLILPSQQRSSSSTSNQPSSSGGRKRRSSASRSWRQSNSNNSYFKLQSGSISKSKYHHQTHWWSSRSSSRPLSDLSKQKQKQKKDAYHLLQELLQSGTLIKEAVRRLNINRKCSSVAVSHNPESNPMENSTQTHSNFPSSFSSNSSSNYNMQM